MLCEMMTLIEYKVSEYVVIKLVLFMCVFGKVASPGSCECWFDPVGFDPVGLVRLVWCGWFDHCMGKSLQSYCNEGNHTRTIIHVQSYEHTPRDRPTVTSGACSNGHNVL